MLSDDDDDDDDYSCTTLNNFKSDIRLHCDWKPDSIV